MENFIIKKAEESHIPALLRFYTEVVDAVNKTDVKLGWNVDLYPDINYITKVVKNGECYIYEQCGEIFASAVYNYNVIKEYSEVSWSITEPSEKISTIHTLSTAPKMRGTGLSQRFLNDLVEIIKNNGDVSIHLDVIDTNIPAYKLYERCGFTMVSEMNMYYEPVGTRSFWLFEKNL